MAGQGLLDIGDLKETVTIRGVDLPVHGIGADDIVELMQRFGDIFGLFQGADGTVGVAKALRPAVAAVIATATGNAGDEKAEARAASLSVGEQASLLAAIRRLTMPQGLRPFLLDLCAIGLPLQEVVKVLDAATTSETSPEPSSSLSNGVTPKSGRTRQDASQPSMPSA